MGMYDVNGTFDGQVHTREEEMRGCVSRWTTPHLRLGISHVSPSSNPEKNEMESRDNKVSSMVLQKKKSMLYI